MALPHKILEIKEGQAIVSCGGKRRAVELALIDSPKVGDWLICHGDLALNKLNPEEAQEILKLQKTHQSH